MRSSQEHDYVFLCLVERAGGGVVVRTQGHLVPSGMPYEPVSSDTFLIIRATPEQPLHKDAFNELYDALPHLGMADAAEQKRRVIDTLRQYAGLTVEDATQLVNCILERVSKTS